MRKLRWVAVLGLLAFALPGVQALADDHMETTVHGEIRMRGENVNNYYDFDDDGSYDSFSFAPYRVRLGVGTSFGDKVYGYAEMQVGDFFGADEQADVLQTSSNRNMNSHDTTGELVLYQGYVKMNEVGGSSLSLKFGRQEYVQGNELLFGDRDFYNGTSLDGVRARWDLDAGPLDVVWFRLAEDFSDGEDPAEDDDFDLFGANFSFNDVLENGDVAVYLYSVNGTIDFDGDADVELFLLGGRAGQTPEDGDSGFLWNAEIALEEGDIDFGGGDDPDVSAYIFEGRFGYQWENNHRIYINGFVTSGDDEDDNDNEINSFIWLFGDIHKRNGAGDVVSGAHNLTALSLGWGWHNDDHAVRAEVFQFTATEKHSYVDLGSDYGLPGGRFMYLYVDEEDDLGTELDVVYNYTVNENFGFEAGVALFQPGDAVMYYEGIDDDITRLWGQARLRF